MAIRPVYYIDQQNKVRCENVSFTWYGGFAKSQVKKCIHSLHEASSHDHILEVSSYSDDVLGINLSAFNLMYDEQSSVECKYQSSKVFVNGGPYLDLLEVPSIKAKKDERLKNSGKLIGFDEEGKVIQSKYLDLFYNYIYIQALINHPDDCKALLEYDGFTDIKFNPEKSNACQAKACCIYISLVRQGKLEEALKDIESFEKIVYEQ